MAAEPDHDLWHIVEADHKPPGHEFDEQDRKDAFEGVPPENQVVDLSKELGEHNLNLWNNYLPSMLEVEEMVEFLAFAGYVRSSTYFSDRALHVGDKFPDFQLPNQYGETISLDDIFKDENVKSVCVFVQRGVWCGHCQRQMQLLHQWKKLLGDVGSIPIILTPDAETDACELDAAFNKKTPREERPENTVDMLSDLDLSFMNKLGMVMSIPREAMRAHLISIPLLRKQEHLKEFSVLPIPGTFVVRRDRTIAFAHVSPYWVDRVEHHTILVVAKHIGDGPLLEQRELSQRRASAPPVLYRTGSETLTCKKGHKQPGLKAILTSSSEKYNRLGFEQYCRDRMCSQGVEFYYAVDAFRVSFSNRDSSFHECVEQAQQIYTRFIQRADTQQSVSVPDQVILNIESKLMACKSDQFDTRHASQQLEELVEAFVSAQSNVFDTLNYNLYPGFLDAAYVCQTCATPSAAERLRIAIVCRLRGGSKGKAAKAEAKEAKAKAKAMKLQARGSNSMEKQTSRLSLD